MQTKQHKKDASSKLAETDFPLKQGKDEKKLQGEKEKTKIQYATQLDRIRNRCLGSNSVSYCLPKPAHLPTNTSEPIQSLRI